MITLGIETSADFGSVALLDDRSAPVELVFSAEARHGGELVVRLAELFAKTNCPPTATDLIAVDIGPGSYTGLRVGVITAKTIAWALGKPIVGVVSLDVIAGEIPKEEIPLCVAIDAKQGEVYARIFEPAGSSHLSEPPVAAWQPKTEPLILSVPQLKKMLPARVLLAGDALRRFGKELIHKEREVIPEAYWKPRSAVVARIGEELYQKGEHDDPHKLQPLYLRRSLAEEMWEKRVASRGS